jgi:hypothetical protein
MANRDNDINTLKDLIRKLRSITLAVQVIPFVYTIIYIGVLVAYIYAREPVLVVLDTLFYVSPLLICLLLVESRILELCKWHKMACVLPTIPQIANLTDSFVWEFPVSGVYVFNLIIITTAVLLLVAADNVFFT